MGKRSAKGGKVADASAPKVPSKKRKCEAVTVGKGEKSKFKWERIVCDKSTPPLQFADMRLDAAIVAGLKRKAISEAAPAQRAVIPQLLTGQDCLLQSPTGSGKTLAYGLPVLSAIVTSEYASNEGAKDRIPWRHRIRGIVLAPSKELVSQIGQVLSETAFHRHDTVSIWSLLETPKSLKDLQQTSDTHLLLVTHPGALIKMCKLMLPVLTKTFNPHEKIVFLPSLRHLVIDEADLILSTYGFSEETSQLFHPSHEAWSNRSVIIIPMGTSCSHKAQVILASATLNQELSDLRKMALHQPVIVCVSSQSALAHSDVLSSIVEDNLRLLHVQIPEEETPERKVKHICFNLSRQRKEDYLSLLCLFKFKWCKPRTLVFAKDVASAYKMYLFLATFKYKCAVISPTQPLSLRLMNINKFNQGIFEILIGCDGTFDDLGEDDNGARIIAQTRKMKKREAPLKRDESSGVSRGLDFRKVSSIISFWPSAAVENYTHLVGRAARKKCDVDGARAITLLDSTVPRELADYTALEQHFTFESIGPKELTTFATYRYRVDDVVNSLTGKAIISCQLQEVASELNRVNGRELSEADQALLKYVNRHNKEKPSLRKNLGDEPSYLLG